MFYIDRSASMGGDRINMVKKALKILLNRLILKALITSLALDVIIKKCTPSLWK